MGPPRERGGTKAKEEARLREEALQWGHRANAVERFAAGTLVAGDVMLQWGHRANAVERLGDDWADVDGAVASMGPPRERGGTVALVREQKLTR